MSVPATLCELRLAIAAGGGKEERRAARAKCKCRSCFEYRRRNRGPR